MEKGAGKTPSQHYHLRARCYKFAPINQSPQVERSSRQAMKSITHTCVCGALCGEGKHEDGVVVLMRK